jgi:general secretion pathway protein C
MSRAPIGESGRAFPAVVRSLKIQAFAPFRQRIPFDPYTSFKAVLLAVLAVLAAQLAWTIVTPAGPFGDWRPAAPRTLSAEAQSAVLAAVDPFFRSASTAPRAGAEAPLDLQLFGTRLGSDGVPGSAILGQPEGEQGSYVVGEEVAPGVKLAAVHFDHVDLDRGGIRQSLYMPDAQAEGAPSAGPSGASLADAFEFKPRMSGAAVTGAIVSPGRNKVPFASSGLRQGDVIVAVNGARITSIIDIQQLHAGLAPGARFVLTVERGAQTIPIPLNLPANQ